MAGKSLPDAAAQEALEEAGISGRVDHRPIGSFRHVKQSFFGTVKLEIVVHALHVQSELSEWPEKRQRTRRWFSVKEAMSRVDSDELRLLIRKLDKRLRQELEN